MSDYRNDRKKCNIGIMGGTFDPIHYGHLVAAEAARAEFGLSKVIFVPSGNPPHKQKQVITSSEHRYHMTVLATASNPGFEVSRLEVDKDDLAYSLNTIKEFRRIYGEGSAIYFITGADAVLELSTWYKIEELLTLCKFIAVTRPGFDKQELEQKIGELSSKYGGEILCIEVPLLEISSTDIRERLRAGRPVKYLIPEAVEEYIKKNGLYKE